MERSILSVFSCLLVLLLENAAAYIEAVAASVDGQPLSAQSHSHFLPQVAFQCGFRNQYLDKASGHWVTDNNRYATCLVGKMDILKYCRKVYPDLEITNIVEYQHQQVIDNWCKESGTGPCKQSHTVQPYTCIVGEFTGQALQVPPGCRFGHVNDEHSCDDFAFWQDKAVDQCGKHKGSDSRTMRVRSFAMLEPCGLDMFSGVEFVCCQQKLASTPTPLLQETNKAHSIAESVFDSSSNSDSTEDSTYSDEDSDEDSDDDEDDYYDDEDEDDDAYWGEDAEPSTARPVPSTAAPMKASASLTSVDDEPYFRLADPEREHENYKAALARLEGKHQTRIAKVMTEWAELENRYTQMKKDDPKYAEQFKSETRQRFQSTVRALEDEIKEQRAQLHKVHLERVQATLNERKRDAIHEYRDALTQSVTSPNAPRVLQSLQAYIRAEEKDRVHTLNHYRYLCKTHPDEATGQRDNTISKLYDLDLRVLGTIQMLADFPDLMHKVKPTAMAFWAEYRRDNTPATTDGRATSLDEAGRYEYVLSLYENGVQVQQAMQNDQHIFGEPSESASVKSEESYDEDEWTAPRLPAQPLTDARQPDAYAREDRLVQDMDSWESGSESGSPAGSRRTLLAVGGIALLCMMLVAVVLRQRRARTHKGFIEVDLYTPEERHVAGMQHNGYENPTYGFFEKA